MSDNPNFVATYSSDEIYYGQDLLTCLTDVVQNKAEVDHNHDNVYSKLNHAHTNYASKADLTALGDVVKTKANANHTHSEYAPVNHSHNDLYYTEEEIDTKLEGKAASNHNHNSSYYTKTQIDEKDTNTLNSAKSYADNLNSSMDTRMDNVEAKLDTITSGAEVNQNAFSNIVIGSTTITADSKTDSLTMADGTGISITADATNDKVTITNAGVRSISTGSTNGTISVNTNGTSKNVSVKGLGSAAYTASSAYDAAGTAQEKADEALTNAKAYTDAAKNSLLNGAGAAYDTLKELGDLIDENTDAIDALETIAANKANASDLTAHTSNNSNPHNVTLGQLGVTATAAELNKMDGVTATTAELNKMDGVTVTTAEINYLDGVTANIQTQLDGKASSSHTHKYAGASTVGGAATSANKLNTNAGSATNPVYFANGVPVKTTYTLGKSVPSNAVFTDTTYSNATESASGLMSGNDKTQLNHGGIPIVNATSTDGVVYTATVPNITVLTVGQKITIIPNMNSTNVNAKLNVNGLGDKLIRFQMATNNTLGVPASLANWMSKDKPLTIFWDGTYWKTEKCRPDANTIYGTVKVENGGTGGNTAAKARENLDVYSKEEVDALFAQVTAALQNLSIK